MLLRSSGVTEELENTGIPLGMFGDSTYEDRELMLEREDLLFCYTDGATDQRQIDGSRFGNERLKEALFRYARFPCPDLVRELAKAIGAEVDDDITLVAVRYKGNSRAP